MSKKSLEKRYGVTIADDSYWNPLSGKYVKQYKMYSADGCLWENGLTTIKAVEEECRRYGDHLLHIKKNVEKYKDV